MAVIRAGRRCPSLRLVQDTFNTVSFPLYSKLGFAVCGTIATISGKDVRLAKRPRGVAIREATGDDAARISALDKRLTGITRPQDVHYFLRQSHQLMSFLDGKLSGYLCMFHMGDSVFLGPAAASTPAALRALISQAAEREQGKTLRMRFPTRHHELFLDMMKMGFRVEALQTFMVRGPWKAPKGTDLLALFPESL